MQIPTLKLGNFARSLLDSFEEISRFALALIIIWCVSACIIFATYVGTSTNIAFAVVLGFCAFLLAGLVLVFAMFLPKMHSARSRVFLISSNDVDEKIVTDAEADLRLLRDVAVDGIADILGVKKEISSVESIRASTRLSLWIADYDTCEEGFMYDLRMVRHGTFPLGSFATKEKDLRLLPDEGLAGHVFAKERGKFKALDLIDSSLGSPGGYEKWMILDSAKRSLVNSELKWIIAISIKAERPGNPTLTVLSVDSIGERLTLDKLELLGERIVSDYAFRKIQKVIRNQPMTRLISRTDRFSI